MTTLGKPKNVTRTRIFGVISLAIVSLAVVSFVMILVSQSGDPLAPVILVLLGLGAGAMWQRERRLAQDAAADRLPLGPQSLWPVFLRTANLYERILCLGGAGAILMGAITGLSASGAGREEKDANELLVALGGMEYYDGAAGEGFLGWMWFGIILAILGAVALVAFVAIRAAASRAPQAVSVSTEQLP